MYSQSLDSVHASKIFDAHFETDLKIFGTFYPVVG